MKKILFALMATLCLSAQTYAQPGWGMLGKIRWDQLDKEVEDSLRSIVADSIAAVSSLTADTFRTPSDNGGIFYNSVQADTKVEADSFKLKSGGVLYRLETASSARAIELYNQTQQSNGKNAYFEHYSMDQDNVEIRGGTTTIDRIKGQPVSDRYFIRYRDNYDDVVTIQSGTINGTDHFAFGDIAFDGDTLWTIYRAGAEHYVDVDTSALWMEYSVNEGATWTYSHVALDSPEFDERAPSIAFLSDDSLIMTCDLDDSTVRHIKTWKSGNSGRTWNTGVEVATGTHSRFAVTDRVQEYEGGELGFMFYESSGTWQEQEALTHPAIDTSRIWYAYSSNKGNSWDTVLVVEETDEDYHLAEPAVVGLPPTPTYTGATQRLYGTCRWIDYGTSGDGNQYEFYSNDAGRTWLTRQGSLEWIQNDPPSFLLLPSDHIVMCVKGTTGQYQRLYISNRHGSGQGWPTWQGYSEMDLTYGYTGMVHLGGGRVGIAFMRQSTSEAGNWRYITVDLGAFQYQLENSRLRVGEVYPTQNYAIDKYSEFAGQITLTAATTDTLFISGLKQSDLAFITQDGSSVVAGNRSVEVLNNFLVVHSDSTITATFNYWILRQR